MVPAKFTRLYAGTADQNWFSVVVFKKEIPVYTEFPSLVFSLYIDTASGIAYWPILLVLDCCYLWRALSVVRLNKTKGTAYTAGLGTNTVLKQTN